ncbi:MAG: peptide-methionine (S)-S-oxide reductase MsrA [Ignavibacteria bacterium]|nr:peptide-methionine (S)-S-oxide reductase MsrA [Ignavibacteria bacterium]
MMATLLIVFFCLLASCNAEHTKTQINSIENMEIKPEFTDTTAVATFGAGCFWCVEAIFQDLKGVYSVESGYMGGDTQDPTYKEVCSGMTGHAEVCRIIYDSRILTFKDMLEVFWQTHDPTTLNRQGNDIGTQYRSAIFYYSDEQKKEAEYYKQEIDKSGAFSDPIVTTLEKASTFYPAEDYHQNYFNQNGDQPYCAFVIKPKVDKFKKAFSSRLKQ